MTGDAPVTALVVDDDPLVRGLVARWLTGEAYHCLQADSAETAWQCLEQTAVDLITLDMRMPGRSGLELLDEIVHSGRDAAILMLTATEDTGCAIAALTRGASAYLLKPVQREELIFHARRAMERRQAMVEKRQYTQRLEETVRQQTAALRRTQEEVVHRLMSASLWRDEETGMHIRRTGLFCEVLAKAAGWSAPEAEDIRMAAAMHDVGKIGIPDAILRKPGKLTPEEFTIMKTHTTIGAGILAGCDMPMLKMAAEIALNHHERWDGSGYPMGRAGQDIPECARMLAIVDVYDALTHQRVYRPAFAEDRALAMMQAGAGAHFDSYLLALFFAHLPEIDRLAREHPDEGVASPLFTPPPYAAPLDSAAMAQ
jgi:putative two-component system response regulator